MTQEIPGTQKMVTIDEYLASILNGAGIQVQTNGVRSNSDMGQAVYGTLGDFVLIFRVSQGWVATGGPVTREVAYELVSLSPEGSILIDGREDPGPFEAWGEKDAEGNWGVYRFIFPSLPRETEKISDWFIQSLTLFRQVMQKHDYHQSKRSSI